MAVFDKKIWNDAVFQKYLSKVENIKENQLLKNGLLLVNSSLKARLVDGVGGSTIEEPIKGLLDGDYVNYDGNTDITASSRRTYVQRKIVVGRAKAWSEKDFSTDLTGVNFMEGMAQEVEEYFQDIDQETLLATLKGIFSMSDTAGTAFKTKHTYDISDATTNTVGSTTLNTAVQKAFGDKKNKVSTVYMHSAQATTLENLQLIEYLKYTDANGIQMDLAMASWNGKLVVIDDEMPILNGYDASASGEEGALLVVASGASTGEINLADVTGSDFYPAGVKATDYVVAGQKYVAYVMGKGAFEYCDIGAKVPTELDRDPSTDGGVDLLYVRKRKMFAPKYISWIGASSIVSPTKVQLETGSNWEIVNDQDASSKTYVNDKLIPFARIISRV